MPDKFGGDGVVVTKERDNFGGLKVSRRRSPLPKPKPAPQSAPQEPPASTGLTEAIRTLVQTITGLAVHQNSKIDALGDQIRRSRDDAAPVVARPDGWEFEIERDRNGFISKVVATPSRPGSK